MESKVVLSDSIDYAIIAIVNLLRTHSESAQELSW